MLISWCLDSQNGVARCTQNRNEEEVADWQLGHSNAPGNLLQDLGRRDFTIDAMTINLEESGLNASCQMVCSGVPAAHFPADCPIDRRSCAGIEKDKS